MVIYKRASGVSSILNQISDSKLRGEGRKATTNTGYKGVVDRLKPRGLLKFSA